MTLSNARESLFLRIKKESVLEVNFFVIKVKKLDKESLIKAGMEQEAIVR